MRSCCVQTSAIASSPIDSASFVLSTTSVSRSARTSLIDNPAPSGDWAAGMRESNLPPRREVLDQLGVGHEFLSVPKMQMERRGFQREADGRIGHEIE